MNTTFTRPACNPGFALLLCLASLLPGALRAQIGQTVTWAGGNTYGFWQNAANWNPQVVPANNTGTNFTVLIPDATSLTYDRPAAATLDALSLGAQAGLRLTNGQPLVVLSTLLVRGSVDVAGPGSAFRAFTNNSQLAFYPSLSVRGGGYLGVGAGAYNWAQYNASATLLNAVGTGSLLELTNVTSLSVASGSGGSRSYAINARSNGVINLSALGQITGPGDDDWVDLNVDTGGNLLLSTLGQTANRVRFNLNLPAYTLPALSQASDTVINVGVSNQVNVPLLGSFTSGTFAVSNHGTLFAPALTTLDSVTVNLSSDAIFSATNLATYRNSDINFTPGRQQLLGPVFNIYASRLVVSGGTTGKVFATSYDCWEDWRSSPTLFSASGASSRLDLSSLVSLTARGGWSGSHSYHVTATTNGVIDLTGLTTVNGCRVDAYDANDWLTFNTSSGGEILLPALRTLTRNTRWNLGNALFRLPALETVDRAQFYLPASGRLELPAAQSIASSYFSIPDGAAVDAPQLTSLSGSDFAWGFSSSFTAPALTQITDSVLAFDVGRTLNIPAAQHIYASRLGVSGGRTYTVAATSYDCWQDWRASPTLFAADGSGSRLNLATLQSLTVHGGWGGSWTYNIQAANSGVIDLSGLTTVTGCRTDAYDNNDWLSFNISNGGQVLLPAVQTITRRTRFNLGVPLFQLPSLQVADNAEFNLPNGGRLELPAVQSISTAGFSIPDNATVGAPQLTYLYGATFTWGFNSSFLAPGLREIPHCDLNLVPGMTFTHGPLTNIFAARLSVSGGRVLDVAAQDYDTWPDWRTTVNLLTADGSGSSLNLASVRSLAAQGGWGGVWAYNVNAINNGVVDLASLTNITGCRTDAYEADDSLAFNVNNGGFMRLGSPVVTRRAFITVAGSGSELEAHSPRFQPPATVTVNNQARLRVRGDLRFDLTDPSAFVVENAFVQMDGAQPQQLEVGGRDSGPGGFTTRNFGYSQLMVGSSNQTSVVRLVDASNNGNRGAGGEAESLYLYGVDGAGLRILHGSRLVLNNLNAYALVAGQMRSLRSLIPAGSNSVPFDAGFIASTGGPRVTNLTPSVTVVPAVSSVDITFDQPIQAVSFTTADVSLTGPGGAITPGSVAPLGGNTWRIQFPAQSTDGTYTVRIGPAINELGATLAGMDQNLDGRSGDGTNDTFVGTFVIDGTAPQITGAFALQNGTRVGVTFNEPPVPAWATNAANYLVNGAVPLRADLRANGKQVILWVNPITGDALSLTANGVVDSLDNTAARSVTGIVLAMDMKDIGTPGTNPRELGAAAAFSEADFEVVAGGSDFFWNGSDGGHFDADRRAGDFDVRVRVQRLDRTSADGFAQAGLMWRESLAANSRHVFLCVTPTNGGNRHYGVMRTATGAAGFEWTYSDSGALNGIPLPNAWVRLKREGNVFTGYRGTNGLDWTELGGVTNALPAEGYLGLGTSARNNAVGQITTAVYEHYGDISPAIVSHPQSQAVTAGANVLFGVTARGLPVLTYQWQHNGVALPGETNASLALLNVNSNRVGAYRVLVSNAYGITVSQEAQLTVDGVGLGGFEADLNPAPLGNNAVTVADWVKVGRLVAGLDSPLNSSEFARADCAPRTNALLGTLPRGDARLSVADWTQAGRYAAGVDPLTAAGGPTAPIGGAPPENGGVITGGRQPKDGSVRSVRLVAAKVAAGETFTVPVELVALGGENALGFSVLFDPAQLVWQRGTLGDGAAGASFQINAGQAAAGAVGLVLARPFGQGFTPGTATVARLEFRAVGGPGQRAIEFADAPVWREVADANATVQPATYVPGVVRIVAPGVLSPDVRFDGPVVELRLTGEPGERYRVESSPDLHDWSLVSEVTAATHAVSVRDASASTAPQRFFRAVLVP